MPFKGIREPKIISVIVIIMAMVFFKIMKRLLDGIGSLLLKDMLEPNSIWVCVITKVKASLKVMKRLLDGI